MSFDVLPEIARRIDRRQRPQALAHVCKPRELRKALRALLHVSTKLRVDGRTVAQAQQLVEAGMHGNVSA
jgi:hypothetical protein